MVNDARMCFPRSLASVWRTARRAALQVRVPGIRCHPRAPKPAVTLQTPSAQPYQASATGRPPARPQTRSVIRRLPAVLGMNVKGQLRPQLAFLASLGVPCEEMGRLVLQRPLILGPGIDPVVAHLR